ncbi:MAG: FmdB family zinc ribbon protein [Steroidobacteraceae bacterium]
MPFYEYECTNCKFYVEALQKISDPPMRKCPSCKKQTLKRLVSAPVFRLKGGGWYETDFKSDQEGKRNLAVGEEAAEAKSDDKVADDKVAEGKAADDKTVKPAESAKEADKKPAGGAATRKAAKKKPSARPAPRASKGNSKAKPKAAKRASKRRR